MSLKFVHQEKYWWAHFCPLPSWKGGHWNSDLGPPKGLILWQKLSQGESCVLGRILSIFLMWLRDGSLPRACGAKWKLMKTTFMYLKRKNKYLLLMLLKEDLFGPITFLGKKEASGTEAWSQQCTWVSFASEQRKVSERCYLFSLSTNMPTFDFQTVTRCTWKWKEDSHLHGCDKKNTINM